MPTINNVQCQEYRQKPLGNYLIEAGLITEEHIFQALQEQTITQEKIGEILVNKGYINQNTVDYLIEKVVEPDRSNNRFDRGTQNNYQIASNRLTKTLTFPTLEISPKKVLRLLLIIVFSLIAISSLVQFGAFFLNQSSSSNYSGRLFRLDEEINIPTLYSSLALAFSSILLGIISYMKKVANSQDVNYWKILSLIFLYLAVDEMCSIHEMLSTIRPLLNAGGLFYFTWVIPGLIFVVIFVALFWRFIQSLPRKTRNLFLISGAIYVGGAIGIEMIGGYHSEAYGEDTPLYSLITTIEESMEMLGIVLFIYALLSYITSYLKTVNFQVSFRK